VNPDHHIADAIAAASLVLAILAALYSLWLSDVTAALDLEAKADRDDRTPQRKQVTRALLTKAVPLSLATIAGASILFPRSRAVLRQVDEHWQDWVFDDVKALFVLTEAMLILLTIVAFAQLLRLIFKRISLG
jgi:hypothetical protein